MNDYYQGIERRSTGRELRHYRTKGSRNGYSKYSWYTPIGEKARGPQQYVPIRKPFSQNRNKMERKSLSGYSTQPTTIGMRMDDRTNDYSGKEMLNEYRKISDESERGLTAQTFLYGLLTQNPVYVVAALKRYGKAAGSFIKTLIFKAQRALNKNTDKETGFKLKNKETSPESDLERVNPEVNNFNTNTKSNCMACTAAYVLRRKGYDVQATKASVGYKTNDLVDIFPNAKIDRFSSRYRNIKDSNDRYDKAYNAVNGQNVDYAMDIISQMEKKYPDGAVGNIMVEWGAGGGHSMVFEIRNGKMIIRDAQVNKTYKNPVEILRYATNIYSSRLDNVDFDSEKIKIWAA